MKPISAPMTLSAIDTGSRNIITLMNADTNAGGNRKVKAILVKRGLTKKNSTKHITLHNFSWFRLLKKP